MGANGTALTKEAAPSLGIEKQARELIETVVFVLVLVSLLRVFGAEAFEIPTGSMATTLLGANKPAKCPQCGYQAIVNGQVPTDGGFGRQSPIESCLCENCAQPIDLRQVKWAGGDRVLVGKFLYEGLVQPQRWEVIVFKCPETKKSPENYIKRCTGLPGESLKVRQGDIHVKPKGGFEYKIARKPTTAMMTMRRLVYDADFPPADAQADGVFRWSSAANADWTANEKRSSWNSTGKGGELAYSHRPFNRPGDEFTMGLVNDFDCYNTGNFDGYYGQDLLRSRNWVGDLMLECTVEVAQAKGKLVVELNQGSRVFACILDFDAKKVSLVEHGRKETNAPFDWSPGNHSLRFADFDERLTVWLDGKLPFGEGVEIEPTPDGRLGPTEGDLRPVRIGADGPAVKLSALKLYRDTYYTQDGGPDWYNRSDDDFGRSSFPSSLADYRQRVQKRTKNAKVYEIPDEHYFMMGDNSPQSLDSRLWNRTHFVPRNLILGRALSVYWPWTNWQFVQ